MPAPQRGIPYRLYREAHVRPNHPGVSGGRCGDWSASQGLWAKSFLRPSWRAGRSAFIYASCNPAPLACVLHILPRRAIFPAKSSP